MRCKILGRRLVRWHPWLGGWTIEPKHIGGMIIPDGHDKDHVLLRSSSHGGILAIGRCVPSDCVGLAWKSAECNKFRSAEKLLRKKTYFSFDELEILRTLGITVSSSVLGTSLVCGVLAPSSVCIHL